MKVRTPKKCKRLVWVAGRTWQRCGKPLRFVTNDVAVGLVCDGCGAEVVIKWR